MLVDLKSFEADVRRWQAAWQAPIERFAESAVATADGAHDLAHIRRVVRNAIQIGNAETANPMILLPAAWLHDYVVVAKDSPERQYASRLAATSARQFLRSLSYPVQWLDQIEHAIIAHSFSAQVEPRTVEAAVLQDADRLDALGAIGIARCFVTAGTLGGELYESTEPIACQRTWDDRRYAVDHFFVKLLRLPVTMKTAAGKHLAATRAERLREFLRQMADEADWDATTLSQALDIPLG